MERQILHVDMDEFFAAVEKLDNPALRGRPVLVGGDPAGRGVVSTASYEARPLGCRSAMPMATAVRLCPEAVVLPVRERRYAEISREVFAIFERFTPLVEPLSIDEAFLDVTGSRRLHGPAESIARRLKAAIRDELGLIASVGVAPNKFLAKLASDLDKPDGLTVIRPHTVHDVLDPLPVGRLWGVGPAAEHRLGQMGIRTIGQLRAHDADGLKRRLGSLGEHIRRLANGEDDRAVVPHHAAKSIGQEQTFPRDVDEPEALRRVLLGQTEQVGRRLRRHELKARTVTLKLRTGDFATRTRTETLPEPTDVTDELWHTTRGLFDQWAGAGFRPLRLIGMTASLLERRQGHQLSLFEPLARRRQGQLDRTLDEIADRFGYDAVRRGYR